MHDLEDRLFTVSEVSEYLKIPKGTIYKLAEYSDLPSFKVGKQLRFKKSSIDRWLSDREIFYRQERDRFVSGNKDEASKHKLRHILLIDDDTLIIRSISRLLTLNGYTVESSLSGEEALEKLSKTTFNLIIADIRLQGINGIQTMKMVREFCQNSNHPPIPGILITGYTDPQAEQEAERLGITDYLYKPFANADLLNRIEKRLNPVAR